MTRAATIGIAAVVLAGAHAIAQAPARDAIAPRVVGSATISGTVVSDAPQPQPVRRAIVTIRGSELPRSRSAITDDQGRFAFTELPAGRFTLTAARNGYLTSAYGARRPGRPGVPVAIASGKGPSGLVLKLARGAVITGTVTSSDGQPVQDVQVTVFGADAATVFEGGAGRGASSPTRVAGSSLTDDRGVYRLYGLAPGTYIVVANPRNTGLGEMGVQSEAEIDAALKDLQRRTASSASAPGAGTSSVVSDAHAGAQPRTFAYAPVYFPGTPIVAEAARVVLDTGEERTGADITLSVVPTATVSGSVVGADGQPAAGVQLSLGTGGPSLPASFGLAGGPLGVTSAKDGTFSINTVPPGVFRLAARKENLWGSTEFTVSGQDLAGITVALQPMVKLSGQIVFDSSSAAAPSDLARLRVTLMPASRATTTAASSRTVQPGGKFEILGIVAGTYRLDCVLPPEVASVWTLRSAIVKGRDVLDAPLEIGPGGDVTDVVLTFTDRHTELSGAVRGTAAGTPYFVLVFSADRTLWQFPSRRVRIAPLGNDGRYLIRDLPPGEYLVAALSDPDAEDQIDTAMLEPLARSAVKLTLSDGEQKTQDLRAGGRDR